MLYTSRSGRYKVHVGTDGAIKVQPRECLSQYSAAIYNNHWTIGVFRRKNGAGELVPIQNADRIYAGETLYHFPTYMSSRKNGERISVSSQPDWSEIHLPEHEKKKRVVQAFRWEVQGWEGVPEPTKDLLFLAHSATEIGEMLEVVGVLSETAGETCSLAGLLIFPLHAIKEIVDCGNQGKKEIGWRAAPYGTTAWVYGDPLPPPPAWVRAEASDYTIQAGLKSNDRVVREAARVQMLYAAPYRKAWVDACKAASDTMDQRVKELRLQKRAVQNAYQAAAMGRNNLVKQMLQKIEDEYFKYDPDGRRSLWSPPPNYPNY
jgi:hypothetical protein